MTRKRSSLLLALLLVAAPAFPIHVYAACLGGGEQRGTDRYALLAKGVDPNRLPGAYFDFLANRFVHSRYRNQFAGGFFDQYLFLYPLILGRD